MKEALLFRGGIKTVRRTLADGKEYPLHFKGRTPEELADYFGRLDELKEPGPKSTVARQQVMAKFIAESLVEETTGEPLMTYEEARLIPGTLKFEITAFIVNGSNGTIEEAKKD